MLHTYARVAQFIGNYRYYRKVGFYRKAAWHLAGTKLPT